MKKNVLYWLLVALFSSFWLPMYAAEGAGIVVEPAETAVTLTWPTDPAAQSYQLDIYHDGTVFCRLTLGAKGQLLDIAFKVPGHHPNEQMVNDQMTNDQLPMTLSFMVTGLDAASRYNYVLSALDANGTPLHVYIGDFATTGYTGELQGSQEVIPTPPIIPSNPEAQAPTGIEQTEEKQCSNGVVLLNGQLFIRRDGKTYSVTGQIVQ